MNVAFLVMPDANATASICAMTSLTFMGASDFASFVTPPTIYRYDISKGTQEVWAKESVPIASERFEVKQVKYASKDGTVDNIMAVEDAGIRADFPLADTEHRESPYYPLAAFRYDADQDTFWCPQGHPLRRYQIAWAKELVGAWPTSRPRS